MGGSGIRWNIHTHTHTTVLLLVCNMSGSTWVSRYQKGKTKKVKTNLDLLEQEIVSASGICWAICKSAPHADNHDVIPPLRWHHWHQMEHMQIICTTLQTDNTPVLHHSVFTGQMPFLLPNQSVNYRALVS